MLSFSGKEETRYVISLSPSSLPTENSDANYERVKDEVD
jgi:hypothetical protein